MSKIIGYFFTPIFVTLFVGTLLLFQIPLYLAFNLGGYRAHKVVLEWMNVCIIWSLRTAGTRFKFINEANIPTGKPLIIISNHQSMYDIPMLILTFKKYNPLFVAKVELSRGIPSISYALRHMGSVLIDRKDSRGAITAIQEFGRMIKDKRYAACIFPEGTRARDGEIKKFKPAGFSTLLKEMPEALVVPVTICGAWRLLRYKFWPVPFGTKVTLKVHEPLTWDGGNPQEFCEKIEAQIRAVQAQFPN